MFVFPKVTRFLQQFCSIKPCLLALSGGPDSIYLFHCLLAHRKSSGIVFHVAHVDHGWRKESVQEALWVENLACQHGVPFHLKILQPTHFIGNQENFCREERYKFFKEICERNALHSVLTGHHLNDHVETILKRIMEGAPLHRWQGLKKERGFKNLNVLRPLLDIPKQSILEVLQQENIRFCEDVSNQDNKFLRGRLRKELLPMLNQTFGKKVEASLLYVSQEAEEITSYFKEKIAPILYTVRKGIHKCYLDLSTQVQAPLALLEYKYLLRLLIEQQNFFLSRTIIAQASEALYIGRANQSFSIGDKKIIIDRKRIFITKILIRELQDEKPLVVVTGDFLYNGYYIEIREKNYNEEEITSWEQAWLTEELHIYLPLSEDYELQFIHKIGTHQIEQVKRLKKKWSANKIPSFLYSYFPCIWKRGEVYSELLTAKNKIILQKNERCWHIHAQYKQE